MIAICVGFCELSRANDPIRRTYGNTYKTCATPRSKAHFLPTCFLPASFLLPSCLQLWCDDLRGTSDAYGGFVEHFYPVLADRAVFCKHLTTKQIVAVSEFMRRTILEEIDDQRGLAYHTKQLKELRQSRS